MEDLECSDKWQAKGNCLSATTGSHSTCGSYPSSVTMKQINYVCGSQLDQLQILHTYVPTEGPAFKEFFGSRKHNYSHWLMSDLVRFVFLHPDAVCSTKRDASPCAYFRGLVFVLNQRTWSCKNVLPGEYFHCRYDVSW